MSERSSTVPGPNLDTIDRAELLSLYKTAIEEYRFEVNLGWDRQKFFVGLNVSLLGALAGFAKLGDAQAHSALLAGALLANALTGLVGISVIWRATSTIARRELTSSASNGDSTTRPTT